MSHTVRAVPVFLALAALFCLSVRPAVAQPAVSYLGVDVFGGLAPHTRNNAPEGAESFKDGASAARCRRGRPEVDCRKAVSSSSPAPDSTSSRSAAFKLITCG